MKLIHHATINPDKPAVINANGGTLSFIELEQQSAQLAHLLHELGLRRGDNIAILLKNCHQYLIIAWAAQRSLLHPCKAVITPSRYDFSDSKELAKELIQFCQQKIAHFKCPRRIDFASLPRIETGKLLRRKLKEYYATSEHPH